MKILFLVHGLGEYAQAQAVADLLQKNKETVFFLTKDKLIKDIIFNDNFNVLNTDDGISQWLEQEEADALFLCNSHTTSAYNLIRPKRIKKVFSLDSNWLFNNKKYISLGLQKFFTYPWIDTIYVVFPKIFFESNLKESGGYYEIDPFLRDKIFCPGFIPSGGSINEQMRESLRNKYNIPTEKKIVSFYFGNTSFHFDKFNKMVGSAQKIIGSVLDEIKKEQIADIDIQKLNTDTSDKTKHSIRFDEELSISDLVIMHYGYGTLSRIFNKKIPVICFIPPVENKVHSNFYELNPCIQKDAIKHLFFKKFEKSELKQLIINLLTDKNSIKKIKFNQKNIFVKGEENLIRHFYQQFK